MRLEYWLKCTVAPGKFTNEFVVESIAFDGEKFSLFAISDDLDFDIPPTEGKKEDGALRVCVIAQNEDKSLFLVQLPQQTLENGQTVTVQADQLESKPSRQEA